MVLTQSEGKLALYEACFDNLWERLVHAIGIHTVEVLFDRAVWEASQKRPELALIERIGTGLETP